MRLFAKWERLWVSTCVLTTVITFVPSVANYSHFSHLNQMGVKGDLQSVLDQMTSREVPQSAQAMAQSTVSNFTKCVGEVVKVVLACYVNEVKFTNGMQELEVDEMLTSAQCILEMMVYELAAFVQYILRMTIDEVVMLAQCALEVTGNALVNYLLDAAVDHVENLAHYTKEETGDDALKLVQYRQEMTQGIVVMLVDCMQKMTRNQLVKFGDCMQEIAVELRMRMDAVMNVLQYLQDQDVTVDQEMKLAQYQKLMCATTSRMKERAISVGYKQMRLSGKI